MPYLGEALGGPAANAVRRTILPYQVGKPGLDRLVAPAQGVIVCVGKLRLGLLIIQCIVAGDFFGQPRQFGGRFFGR